MKARIFNTFFWATLVSLFVMQGGALAASRQVLILPFNIHAAEDLGFLQQGIRDMLATRLAQGDGVAVIPPETTRQLASQAQMPINEGAALELGSRAGADYVIFGSLTVFGGSVSTDARMVDVHQRKGLLAFSEAGQTHGDIITHINHFAGRINSEVFGVDTGAPAPAAPAAQAPAYNPRQHPEALWRREFGVLMDNGGAEAYSPEPSAVLWKTRRFEAQIKGIAVGDVDQDGRNETLFVDDNSLFIYRMVGEVFEKVAELGGSPGNAFIRVDAADIDGNGTAEIFVTNVTAENHVSSKVFEWNGKTFAPLAESVAWYLRVIHVPGRPGPVLLGQQSGYESAFFGDLHELAWEGGRLKSQAVFSLPRGINIYGFAMGDILKEDGQAVVTFTRGDHLKLTGLGNPEEWESSDAYGGSLTYFVPTSEAMAAKHTSRTRDMDPLALEREYMPQRILLTDFDQDGQTEVLVVNNHDTTGRLLKRTRIFRGGHFECLEWDNVGMRKKWRTRTFSGYIADYVLGDLNNDGREELVFALVTDLEKAVGAPASYIVTWNPGEASGE